MNINRFSTRVTACSHGKRQGATSGNMLFMGLATGAYKEHIGILPRDVPCYFPCEQALTVVELIFTYSGSFGWLSIFTMVYSCIFQASSAKTRLHESVSV